MVCRLSFGMGSAEAPFCVCGETFSPFVRSLETYYLTRSAASRDPDSYFRQWSTGGQRSIQLSVAAVVILS